MKLKDATLNQVQSLMAAKANMEVFIYQGSEFLKANGDKGSLRHELISGKMSKDGRFAFKVTYQTKLYKVSKKICMPIELYGDLGESLVLEVDGEEMTWNDALSELSHWEIDVSKNMELKERMFILSESIVDKYPEIANHPSALVDLVNMLSYYENDEREANERMNLYFTAFYRALQGVGEGII